MGTDASLPDTDGDGLLDRLEVALGTDYLHAEGVVDDDGDGVPNADEVRERTDPQSVDAATRLGRAYRYEVEDEGVSVEPVAPALEQLAGVEIVRVSPGTTAGVGRLRFVPGSPARLQWQDAGDAAGGPLVEVPTDGDYRVPSASYADIQGDDGPFLDVRVALAETPPTEAAEQVRVLFRARQCLRYVVRNIRLLDAAHRGPPGGRAQRPVHLLHPGPRRPAHRPGRPAPGARARPLRAPRLPDAIGGGDRGPGREFVGSRPR
ncbi:MAG: thrombospondin type 3 repeat-containing protein [bacterium]